MSLYVRISESCSQQSTVVDLLCMVQSIMFVQEIHNQSNNIYIFPYSTNVWSALEV